MQAVLRGADNIFHMEYSCDHHAGKRWFEMSVTPLTSAEGGLLVVHRDITSVKAAEAAIRESESRFRHVADSSPVMMWMSGEDKLCTYFNQPWLDFTGRPLELELGNGWAEGVHPDDRERCYALYSDSFDARKSFEMEYRLRRRDGEYRWVMDVGVPRFDAESKFLGFIGSCIDITERKAAEKAVLDMSGRLISAHEEERSRIARELHDDLSQRMALLGIRLEQLGMSHHNMPPQARDQLKEIAQLVASISSDIHRLSHQLHPSKLDTLGLVSAVGSYCRDFSEQQGLRVQFLHHNVSRQIPKDVTLCAYRIVQESLRNVVKHSGAREATVVLTGGPNGLELSISDSGSGFDPESAMAASGLGLVSMRERLRPLDGHLIIKSWPAGGTEVCVHIPFSRASERISERADVQRSVA
jgi:PAS domain S-box-containing protein